MSRIWFYILAVMILGNMLKYAFTGPLVWVVIDLAVLFSCYLILKRQPFINMKHAMIFLGGLTLVNVLVDLGILGGIAGNLALLALIGAMLYYGSRPPKYKYPLPRKKYHK